MRKKFLSVIAITVCCALMIGSGSAFAWQPNPDLELIPVITLNGDTFTLENVPHDQQATLNYVNIPINLGEYTAPVTLTLENGSPDLEYVSWHVQSCPETYATSTYFIEPNGLHTVTRVDDEVITEANTIYYESADNYDFNAEVTLTRPNCYSILMDGIDEDTQDSNEYGDIYFTVNAYSGWLDPDFSIEFDHSDVTIFNESLNETPMGLAPEFVTLTDETSSSPEVEITGRDWQIEWHDLPGGTEGNAMLPISSDYRFSGNLSYNFNNPGMYLITLTVKGSNGLEYTKSKWVIVQSADTYFATVLQLRDGDGKDFTDFNAAVDALTDTELKELYTTVLDECTSDSGSMNCSPNALSLMENYDSQLEYLDVPCSHFPDLNGYNSHDELCRAAEVVKDIEAFEGDGPGSPTAGYLRPDSNINRAEICAILNKSKISTGGGAAVPALVADSVYTDLQPLADDDWRKTNAAGCTQFEGYPDGTFRPDYNINAVETLKVLFLIYGQGVNNSYAENVSDYCPELTSDQWYAKYLALAFEKGFMDAVDDNCNPGKFLTRGEVVMLMYRMFFEYEYIPLP